MDIALINSWPHLVDSAEIAFIRRFKCAAEKLGHRVFSVVTSDDIEACKPDFVIALDEISPKLTGFPTFGAMWTPPIRYHREVRRTRSILSYDGYLVGSEAVRSYLNDLEFSLGVEKPKSDFLFLPTDSFERLAQPRVPHRTLAFEIASGDDHPAPDLVAALAAADLVPSRGGPSSANGVGQVSAVSSAQPRLREHGAALCLHTDEQREADLPSGLLFEAAAAGAVIVTDELPFARRVLGNAALFIDTSASRADVVDQVRRHLFWLKEDPGLGERLTAEAWAVLQGRFDLETVLKQCCAFACTAIEGEKRSRLHAVRALQNGPVALRQAAHSPPRAEAYLPERPLVDVVVRVGERPTEVIHRALRSIAMQDSGRYRAILVDYKGDKELKAFANGFQAKNMVVTYVRSPDTGYRSTALWAGLARVEAPFFAILDDDDSLTPDHFPSLIELASRYPRTGLFYAGTIRVEDEGGVSPPNLMGGPLELQYREHRELKFLEPHDLSRLMVFDNYITSNSFIGRAELLNQRILVDPQLEVGEDVYLLLLLASQTEFRSSFRPTALWHWRSVSRDQSMLVVDSERWRRAAAKLALRLAYVPLPATMTLSRVVQPPFVLELGVATAFDPEVVARSQGGALNPGEPAGVWTSATRSFMRLLLSDFIQNGRIFLEFAASGASPAATQNVRISMDDQPIYCGGVQPWVMIRVEQPFRFARRRNVAILRVECDSTFSPRQAGEEAVKGRELGVLLSKILIEREDRRRRRPEWVCALMRFLRRRRISAPTA